MTDSVMAITLEDVQAEGAPQRQLSWEDQVNRGSSSGRFVPETERIHVSGRSRP